MNKTDVNQCTDTTLSIDDSLTLWLEAFLIDRKAQNMASGTLYFYRMKLKLFADYAEGQVINRIGELSPGIIRRYLLYLEETNHNPGGIHAAYRALKTFLLWFEEETEPEGWKNPIRKVKAPRIPTEALEPVEAETIRALLKTCELATFIGTRDYALILFLLDTGVRAAECLAVNLVEANMITGEILIRAGKGRKPRTVYLEKRSRRALRNYLKKRGDKDPALWVTDEFERLSYSGMREILRRRAARAKVKPPTPHDFRRAFALGMLRRGIDLVTLSKLMGHSSIIILQRYLKQANIDLKEAHSRGSPVESMNG